MGFLIEKWFNKKISLDRIEKYCQQLSIERRRLSEDIDPDDIRVSCVQRQIHPVNSIERYIDMLCGFIDQAVKDNSHLIIFPEYNFFDLFGLIPGFNFLNQILNKKAIKMEVYSLPFGKVVCPICMDATYFETFRIAREIGADMVILPIANLEE